MNEYQQSANANINNAADAARSADHAGAAMLFRAAQVQAILALVEEIRALREALK